MIYQNHRSQLRDRKEAFIHAIFSSLSIQNGKAPFQGFQDALKNESNKINNVGIKTSDLAFRMTSLGLTIDDHTSSNYPKETTQSYDYLCLGLNLIAPCRLMLDKFPHQPSFGFKIMSDSCLLFFNSDL